MKPANPDWPEDVEHRLRRIERTVPYLFRLCAILAAFQVFLIAVGRGLTFDLDLRMWKDIPYSICCFEVE